MNLFNPKHHERLVERINSLAPTAERRWGTMSLPQTLAHMSKQIELALGDLVLEPFKTPAGLPILRELLIFVLPWPKGLPTVPELVPPDVADVEAERAKLLSLIGRVVERGVNGPWKRHVAFGNLSGRAWGTLMGRHLDHHLRQFGA